MKITQYKNITDEKMTQTIKNVTDEKNVNEKICRHIKENKENMSHKRK
jgi:hypothetical protein